jgi:hypothetical protein
MRVLVFWFLMVCVIGLAACSGDDSSSETPRLINTSWTRINRDDAGLSFRVKMDFFSDHYDFLLLQAAEGHTDSTATIHVVSETFYILEDADCAPPEGQYTWQIENDVLDLARITDACDGRIKAIEGQWNRFGTTILNTSWTRVISDGDIRFKVRLDFHEQTFDFVLLEDAPGHDDSSGRLEVIGQECILSEDVDCEGATGRYAWVIIDHTLEINVLEDECAPRATALIGQWDLFLPSS